MTKSELAAALAQRSGITMNRADQVVRCVFDEIVGALERGERLEVRGFGTFSVREYGAYTGRNPRTGEAVSVPPKRLPFFRVGKALKALVDEPTQEAARVAHHPPGPEHS